MKEMVKILARQLNMKASSLFGVAKHECRLQRLVHYRDRYQAVKAVPETPFSENIAQGFCVHRQSFKHMPPASEPRDSVLALSSFLLS